MLSNCTHEWHYSTLTTPCTVKCRLCGQLWDGRVLYSHTAPKPHPNALYIISAIVAVLALVAVGVLIHLSGNHPFFG